MVLRTVDALVNVDSSEDEVDGNKANHVPARAALTGQQTSLSSPSPSAFTFIAKIEEFAKTASASDELHLSANLGRYERLVAHEKAGSLGLEHASVGDGPARHIVVRRCPK